VPHDNRRLMQPQPVCSFAQVFSAIWSRPQKMVTGLMTTGGVDFEAEARHSQRVGSFIALPHNNRIYPCCWGNTTNHMGKREEGQRIGQYARPLDEWCQELLGQVPSDAGKYTVIGAAARRTASMSRRVRPTLRRWLSEARLVHRRSKEACT